MAAVYFLLMHLFINLAIPFPCLKATNDVQESTLTSLDIENSYSTARTNDSIGADTIPSNLFNGLKKDTKPDITENESKRAPNSRIDNSTINNFKALDYLAESSKEFIGGNHGLPRENAIQDYRSDLGNDMFGIARDDAEDAVQNASAQSEFNNLNNIQTSDRAATSNSTDDGPCEIKVCDCDIRLFRHIVYYKQMNLMYLHLRPNKDVTLNSLSGVVGKQYWSWTYYGKTGALQYLRWPVEFKIWSLGLLSEYVNVPMNIHIERVRGDCSNITIGTKKGDRLVAKALVPLTKALMEMGHEYAEKYGPSFWCYSRRMFINPQPLYELCKHFFCPVDGLESVCLSYHYQKDHRVVSRHESIFVYDYLLWYLPTVIAVILFVFFPLLLMNLSWRLSKVLERLVQKKRFVTQQSRLQTDEHIVYLDNHYRVTLFNTLFGPLLSVVARSGGGCWRVYRFFLPYLSIIIILVQIICDYIYFPHYLSACVDSGVPMGFRSMLAGFKRSAENFLPILNGPYTALSAYLLIASLLAAIPRSLSGLLETGLPQVDAPQSLMLLKFSIKEIEKFGSVPSEGREGYLKIYSVYLGQFYMLLNVQFWKYCGRIQINRWCIFATTFFRKMFLPFYVVFSCLELVLVILVYGMPIFSLALTIIRAYRNFFQNLNRFRNAGCCLCFARFFLMLLLIVSVAFFFYMFCIVFLDGSLFLSRVFIFTYTGIIMYPKASYGYFIFAITVVYYLWDCVKNFSLTYRCLLKDTIHACLRCLPANELHQVVFNKGGFKGVKESLFEHVIEMHCPRRKQVLLSLLKLAVILGIIGVSLGLLTKTNTLHELHTTVHVGTTLFACALPQIVKSTCGGKEARFTRMRSKQDISYTVRDYMGYFVEDFEEDSDLEMVDII